jgi:hypothetical protein
MKTNIILQTTLLLYCATTAVADTHIKAKYTSDGRVTESVTYLKGERQRIEYGKDMAILNQADIKLARPGNLWVTCGSQRWS